MRFGLRRRGRPRTPGESRYYVRPAERADLPAVLAMKLVSWREAYGALRDEEFFTRAEDSLPAQVEHWAAQQRRGTGIWLAEDLRDRVVGMASLEPASVDSASLEPAPSEPNIDDDAASPAAPASTGPAQLRTLYVLAEAQGTGVADALMHAALNHAALNHATSTGADITNPASTGASLSASATPDVVLTVLENNPRALAFYRRHGFEIVGDPIEMTGPWAGLREVRMVRRG